MSTVTNNQLEKQHAYSPESPMNHQVRLQKKSQIDRLVSKDSQVVNWDHTRVVTPGQICGYETKGRASTSYFTVGVTFQFGTRAPLHFRRPVSVQDFSWKTRPLPSVISVLGIQTREPEPRQKRARGNEETPATRARKERGSPK